MVKECYKWPDVTKELPNVKNDRYRLKNMPINTATCTDTTRSKYVQCKIRVNYLHHKKRNPTKRLMVNQRFWNMLGFVLTDYDKYCYSGSIRSWTVHVQVHKVLLCDRKVRQPIFKHWLIAAIETIYLDLYIWLQKRVNCKGHVTL